METAADEEEGGLVLRRRLYILALEGARLSSFPAVAFAWNLVGAFSFVWGGSVF